MGVPVAVEMGLADGLDSEVLRQAAGKWGRWCREDDRLAGVGQGLAELRPWLRAASPQAADQVLHALARRGAVDGGDEVAAAAVLAWALMPGACTLAQGVTRRLRPRDRARVVHGGVDHLVAAELWLQIRVFPWRRLGKVAANILLNTRAGVLRELGVGRAAYRADPTWWRVELVEPWVMGQVGAAGEEEVPAATRLTQVLDGACRRGVIGAPDRALLLSVVAAGRTTPPGAGRGRPAAPGAVDRVAADLGVHAGTVRRRLTATVAALTAAVAAA